MTNRERVISAINFRTPDYIPHDISFTQPMYEKMVAYTGDENYYNRLNNHICSGWLPKPQTEVAPGFFKDEFGVIWNKSGVDKDIGVIDNILIAEPSDLSRYEFPDVDEAFIRATMEHFVARDKTNFKIAGIGFSLFERAWTLRGMENLMCDMIAEPTFVHELMEKIFRRNMRVIDIALQYDFDCFYFGDDWGQQRGLIMGPECWREFIKPYLAQMYAKVRDAGRFVCQHSCGDIREIMDDVCEAGLNIYQTYQPEIYGLDYAETVLKNKLTIWGGISTQRDLPVRTPDEIRAIVRDLMSHFPTGGLIAAPTHSVPADVPPENIVAMVDVFLNQQA